VPVAPAVPQRSTLAPAQLVLASGERIALPAAAQALLGRADTASNVFPDIDLTPHGALERGVGRRHFQLRVQGGTIVGEDMASTNGSFVNGQKLAPRTPVILKNGDELRLGQLVLRLTM
jgi:hypothetical protein